MSYFCIHSASLCLLVGAFNPFMFKVIIDKYDQVSWLIGKDFDVGRDWGQEKKGTTEDEMAGWHH